MLTPSPTQQPPSVPEPGKDDKYNLPGRKGEQSFGLFLKAIFRPILKGLYYILRFMGSHKLLTLLLILLLIGSGVFTSFLVTKQGPFGIGNDPFQLRVDGKLVGGGDNIRNWLYHLRDGNAVALSLDDKVISQPPDPTQLISQYSQPGANLEWKDINVLSSYQQADTTVDTFVSVDLASKGPGGQTKGVILFHFVTVSQGSSAVLIAVDTTGIRALLQ
ncbi:MAG: hypothetical protein M3Y39_06005 [Chloroflexota bacterium]|nr:hypothetical protein [Chloroflexota bacterium]